nr:hypothetical protein [Clostridium saccharoperbutylacetonicum]
MSLCACGNSSGVSNETINLSSTTSPKQTVEIAFEALKNANSTGFNQFIQYNERQDGIFIYKDNKLFGNNLDGEGKKFIESVFANLSYEIGEVNENDDLATVKIKITNRDLSNVYNDILHYKDSDNPLIEAIKNANSKMVTSDLKITLNKTSGIWKIKMDKSLMNAICGGLEEK